MQIYVKRHNILTTDKGTFFIASAEKIDSVREFKIKYFEFHCWWQSYECSYTVVFNVQAILHFLDNFHLLRHPKKVPEKYFDSFNFSIAQIKQACKFPNFCLPEISSKTDLKFS